MDMVKLRQWAVLLGAPLVGGLLAWQLYTLHPKEWCRTAIDLAKLDKGEDIISGLQACVGLQARILEIKDHAVIGLMVVLGLGYIMLMARELGMKASLRGPGGSGAEIGADSAAGAAKQVADAAVDQAEEIIHGEPK